MQIRRSRHLHHHPHRGRDPSRPTSCSASPRATAPRRPHPRGLPPRRQREAQRGHQPLLEPPPRRLGRVPGRRAKAAPRRPRHRPSPASAGCSPLPGARLRPPPARHAPSRSTARATPSPTSGSTSRSTSSAWQRRARPPDSPGVAGAARDQPAQPRAGVPEPRTRASLWGFVSNGLQLRILRDNVSLTRQAYVEFDLEAMMDGEVYSDFALLWLLCHQSRVEAETPGAVLAGEVVRRCAQEQGTRALDQLRDGVEAGDRGARPRLPAHPAKRGAASRQLRTGALDKQDYYRQLLRLVYRLLFLFVAEDRDLLCSSGTPACSRAGALPRLLLDRAPAPPRRAPPRHAATPTSVEALRLVIAQARRRRRLPRARPPGPRQSSSWPRQGPPAPRLCRHLQRRPPRRRPRPGVHLGRQSPPPAIDYRNLGAEELGSVYESLLELHPELNARRRRRSRSDDRRRPRAQDDRQLLHADEPHRRACSTRPSTRSSTRPAKQPDPEKAHPRPQGLRPRLRQRPLPDRRRPPHGQAPRRRPHRRRRALARGRPHGPARRHRPLHLRRRHQPDGRRAVQGQPLAGSARARQAPLVPRPPHPVRQQPPRHDARRSWRRASPTRPFSRSKATTRRLPPALKKRNKVERNQLSLPLAAEDELAIGSLAENSFLPRQRDDDSISGVHQKEESYSQARSIGRVSPR